MTGGPATLRGLAGLALLSCLDELGFFFSSLALSHSFWVSFLLVLSSFAPSLFSSSAPLFSCPLLPLPWKETLSFCYPLRRTIRHLIVVHLIVGRSICLSGWAVNVLVHAWG